MAEIQIPTLLRNKANTLYKLGKYLRILGFDASWEPALRTHELIRRDGPGRNQVR